jgi:hypothetical protein
MNEFIKGFTMMPILIGDYIGEVFTNINWHFVGYACSILVILTVIILVTAIIKDILD